MLSRLLCRGPGGVLVLVVAVHEDNCNIRAGLKDSRLDQFTAEHFTLVTLVKGTCPSSNTINSCSSIAGTDDTTNSTTTTRAQKVSARGACEDFQATTTIPPAAILVTSPATTTIAVNTKSFVVLVRPQSERSDAVPVLGAIDELQEVRGRERVEQLQPPPPVAWWWVTQEWRWQAERR